MSAIDSPVPGSPYFQSVSPIGDTNVSALPVKELEPAITFYTQALGFFLVSKQGKSALLKRDEVRIGLEENDADPEQASCYFSVGNVEALRRELTAKGFETSAIRVDEHEGQAYRVFFAREPYGVCFCFGQAA